MKIPGLENLFYVFGVHPDHDQVQRKLLGKFWLRDGHLKVLEDHGMHRDLEKLSPEAASRHIYGLTQSQRTEVVCAGDIQQGHHPHLLPTLARPRAIPTDLRQALGHALRDQEQEPRHSRFQYHRDGMPGPQVLELHGDNAHLDGHPLDGTEFRKLLENIRDGRAKLRHHVETPVKKSEPGPEQDLQQVSPEAQALLRRHLSSDTLVPALGNRYAYNEFMSQAPAGIHIHINGNDIADINRSHDHDTGTEAVSALGRAVAAVAAESGGKKAQAFRWGGDDFRVHVPGPDEANIFARSLRTRLEATPAVRGTHRLSVSIGMAPDPAQAEEGLLDARAEKAATGRAPGQNQTHVVSRIPKA